MLELHGRLRSNYYNAAKAVLREKQIEFTEVIEPVPPTAEFLQLSPMAKIPCLVTAQGPITETTAIIEYLEATHPSPALLPADPYAQAKQRELCKSLELYIEWVARRGYGALRGEVVSAENQQEVGQKLEQGAAAVSALASFSPWITGDTFTYADIFGYFMLVYARLSAKANAGMNLFDAIPGSENWFKAVAQRPSVASVLADAEKA